MKGNGSSSHVIAGVSRSAGDSGPGRAMSWSVRNQKGFPMNAICVSHSRADHVIVYLLWLGASDSDGPNRSVNADSLSSIGLAGARL